MIELLTIFGIGLGSVFVAGFQSRSVNYGNYKWAAANSFLLSTSNASLWTHITSSHAGPTGWLVYGLAGSIGITASMYIHERFVKKAK